MAESYLDTVTDITDAIQLLRQRTTGTHETNRLITYESKVITGEYAPDQLENLKETLIDMLDKSIVQDPLEPTDVE